MYLTEFLTRFAGSPKTLRQTKKTVDNLTRRQYFVRDWYRITAGEIYDRHDIPRDGFGEYAATGRAIFAEVSAALAASDTPERSDKR